jgi:hypothetical protein
MSSACRCGAGEYIYYAPPRAGGQADFPRIRRNQSYFDLRMSTAGGSPWRNGFLMRVWRMARVGIIGGCRKLDKIDLAVSGRTLHFARWRALCYQEGGNFGPWDSALWEDT